MSRANQFSDPTRGRGKLGHSVPRPILMLHKYCLYLQFHSYIPAVLPIQRMLSQVSRLMLCRGVFLQPWADRRLSSEMGKFLSCLLCDFACHTWSMDWTARLSFSQSPQALPFSNNIWDPPRGSATGVQALASNWWAPIFSESVFLIFQITDGKEGNIVMGACTKIPNRI